ncbi:MAG: hypothetical protein ABL982_20305 [Vicinamibacterales bacterium]
MAMLQEADPKRVVDTIEALAGLPPAESPIPATSPSALAIRVIAEVQERNMLARNAFRASWGFFANDGGSIASWTRLVPNVSARLEPLAGTDRYLDEGIPLVESLWALHAMPPHGGPLQDFEAREPVVVLDLATGDAHRPGQRPVSLPAMYEERGRKLLRVVHSVEEWLAA